jgi:hypothetical protein
MSGALTEPAKLLLLVTEIFYVFILNSDSITCSLQTALLANDRIVSKNGISFIKGILL